MGNIDTAIAPVILALSEPRKKGKRGMYPINIFKKTYASYAGTL